MGKGCNVNLIKIEIEVNKVNSKGGRITIVVKPIYAGYNFNENTTTTPLRS